MMRLGLHRGAASTLRAGLLRIIALTVVAAMVLSALGVLLYELRAFQPRTAREIKTQLGIVALNLVPALDFADSADAQATLATLGQDPRFLGAIVFDAKDQRFVEWRSAQAVDFVLETKPLLELIDHFGVDIYRVRAVIRADGHVNGMVVAYYRMPPLLQRLPQYGIMIVVVGLAIFTVALVLFVAVERAIAMPLRALAQQARTLADVGAEPDAHTSANEIEQLQYDVQRMLQALHSREVGLQEQHEQVRASEQRFRTLIEQLPVAIRVADNHGTIVLYNQQFTQLFGYTRADIPSLEAWWARAYPDAGQRQQIRELWIERIKAAGGDGTIFAPLETEVIDSKGRAHVIELHLTMMDKLSVTCFIDLTERKKAEQDIQAWNEELEERVLRRTKELKFANFALENARNDIALLSDMGRDITATLDMSSIFSMLYERIRLLMDCETFGIGLYQAQTQTIAFDMVIQNGKRFLPYARSMSDKNQLAVWCIDHAQPIFINDIDQECTQYIATADSVDLASARLEDGSATIREHSHLYVPLLVKERVLGLLAVQSSRKNAYLKQHLDMLQTLASYAAIAIDNAHVHQHLGAAHSALQQAHGELKTAQDQLVLQEKMASLGTLTAGVAHEINNPTNFSHVAAQNLEVDLNKFEDYLQNLVDRDEAPEVAMAFTKRFMQLHAHIATVLNGTTRIKSIVKDLRAFTRLDESEKQTVNVSENLQSTLNLVRSSYLEKVDFTVTLATDAMLECYPAQLNQVFMNLIVNACQAVISKQRAGNLPVKGQVSLRSYAAEDAIIVDIEDNGCGMSPDIQARILEPFFTTKSQSEGTGLGLSISYGILRKHDGELQIQSTPGQGSVFTVVLPRRSKTDAGSERINYG